MEVHERIGERVSEHPQTVHGVVAGFLLTVALAVVLRVISGLVLNDEVFLITYLSLLGGGFGATAMYGLYRYADESHFPPIDFWANVLGDGRLTRYRTQGLYLHVTYGALVGSFFPRIVNEVTPTVAGDLFGALPMSLLTATVFAVGVFLLGLLWAQVGLFRLQFRERAIGLFFASHVVYGLVLGLVAGLMQTVIAPLFDIQGAVTWPL